MGGDDPKALALLPERWQRLCLDLKALPVLQAGRLLARKASKGWRMRLAEGTARSQMAELESNLRSVLSPDTDSVTFLDSKFTNLSGFPIAPERIRKVAQLLQQEFPGWVTRCVDKAQRICENRVTVLGHEILLDESPAWHKDYVNGEVWPAGHSARFGGFQANPGSDIKYVWELSRFHHGVTLGRAFAFTGEEKFSRKFVSHFSSWRAANPPYAGPNWACAMEAAIRAVNLLWAGSLLSSSQAFDARTKDAFAKTLLNHGVFIYHNLERSERVVAGKLQPLNGNHYLSNLTGLLYISLAFPEYRQASEWRTFAIRELFQELEMQVDDDGIHWEYSPGYHRLVLEMVLACLILLERQGVPVPLLVRNKVVKMLEFTRHYRKPGGGIPLVRDIDNGRLCILGDDELTSHDHLLSLGAMFFDRPDFLPGSLHEDCYWYLGEQAYEWHKRLPPSPDVHKEGHSTGMVSLEPWANVPESKLFRQSGFSVMRKQSYYLLALCCPKGMLGFCGHTHNDFLSFELEAYGRTFLTDCGSYVYTQSPEWRNRFRSTLSHNTVTVDGCEQNRFNSSDLFEIEACVQPKVRHWRSNQHFDILDAAYTLDLPTGRVKHERRFIFLKEESLWLVRDRITGDKAVEHHIETRFHFADGIEVKPCGEGCYRTDCPRGPNLLLNYNQANSCTVTVDRGCMARIYGVKQPISVLHFTAKTQLPFEQWYVFTPYLDDASLADIKPFNLRDLLAELEPDEVIDRAE